MKNFKKFGRWDQREVGWVCIWPDVQGFEELTKKLRQWSENTRLMFLSLSLLLFRSCLIKLRATRPEWGHLKYCLSPWRCPWQLGDRPRGQCVCTSACVSVHLRVELWFKSCGAQNTRAAYGEADEAEVVMWLSGIIRAYSAHREEERPRQRWTLICQTGCSLNKHLRDTECAE